MKHRSKCRCTSQSKQDDSGQRSRRPSWTQDLPTYWTPVQACAVYELLDDLMMLVWCRYGGQIQQAMHAHWSRRTHHFTCERRCREPF